MPMLSVAPEGTLSHGRCVLTFKRGAFVAGVPVVPFVLRYKLTPHNPAWTIIIPFWHVVSLVTYVSTRGLLPPTLCTTDVRMSSSFAGTQCAASNVGGV